MDGSFCTVQRPPDRRHVPLLGGLIGYTPVTVRRRWHRWKSAAFVAVVPPLWVA